MSIDSLPFMVFLLLVEFTVGGLLVLYGAHLRGLVTRGFLKMGAASVLTSAALATWIALSLGNSADVGGYPLDERFLGPSRFVLAVLLALVGLYTVAVWREREPVGRWLGAAASTTAAICLAVIAAIFRLPAWSYAGVLLSLFAGGLSLGAVTMGMVLGHWYLVTPRLPERPLIEMTLALIVILGAQAMLVVLNLTMPVHQVPAGDAAAVGLLQNPAFWLRIGVGLLFPLILSVMAWRSSVVRGMMSATGLLYVAVGAVLAGEALARGLQLSTAIPF